MQISPDSMEPDLHQIQWDKIKRELQNTTAPHQLINEHRKEFTKVHPKVVTRVEYDPDLAPFYTNLRGENPQRIDQVLGSAHGKQALIVAASGHSLLRAIDIGVAQIDVIDIDPNQLAITYNVAAIVATTPENKIDSVLKDFRNTSYQLDQFASIARPPIRQQHLDALPAILETFQVPEEIRDAVKQNVDYGTFKFDKEMKAVTTSLPGASQPNTLWDEFKHNYDTVQRRLSNKEGWNLHESDLMTWLQAHPDEYAAIYTSNVYQFIRNSVNYPTFTTEVLNSLQPGGIGNIYHMESLPLPPMDSIKPKFSVLEYGPYDMGDDPNWLLIQKG